MQVWRTRAASNQDHKAGACGPSWMPNRGPPGRPASPVASLSSVRNGPSPTRCRVGLHDADT